MRKKLITFLLILITLPWYGFALNPIMRTSYDEGEHLGIKAGEVYGQKDFVDGQRKNWTHAFKEEEAHINSNYSLEDESDRYRTSFIGGFQEGFEEGYEKGYEMLASSDNKTTSELGANHGAFFGDLLGGIHGKGDMYQGLSNNWTRKVPSKDAVETQYSLNRDYPQYANGFVIGYRNAYENSYEESYRMSNLKIHKAVKKNGVAHGTIVGEAVGRALGERDYNLNIANEWRRALSSDQDILTQYRLHNEQFEYQQGFLVGYKDGFQQSYTDAYQESNVELALQQINYALFSIMGNQVESKDQLVRLVAEPGSFYQKTYITLGQRSHSNQTKNSRYIPVGEQYEVKVEGNGNRADLYKSITLEFKYYATERGGIYQLQDNQWHYLYSVIDEELIRTEIPSGSYTGGIYGIFIDNEYKELIDISTHWAQNEIYTFVKRNYVSGYDDQTFRPDDYMSRVEFLDLLSQVYQWNLQPIKNKIVYFNDQETFGLYNELIFEAVSRGIISGYPDGEFKLNNLISYKEVEWIMQKVLEDKGFQWDDISNIMMLNKYTRSASRFGKEKSVTRAEVIYMIHELLK